MSVAPVIDLDAILAPIPGERPGGSDPRENASGSAPYYRVKDARNAARAEERAAVDADAPTPETWSTVVDLGAELLATQAKDLEVAAWLTEALIRTDGFPGLRDGLTVIARLVEEHWDGLFPEPDEDGLETKVSPVAGLNGAGATGTLDRPIRNAPLTDGPSGAFSFWDYEQAVEIEKISEDRRAARIESGAITLETFRKSVAETPAEHLRDTLATVGECEAALARMSGALDLAAGVDSPSVSALQELLAAVGGCLRHIAADRLAALAPAGGAEAVEAYGADAGAAGASAFSGPGAAPVRRPGEFTDREEALTLLTQVAVYFRRTEPHSPISYTIDDAVRRARMTLPELLKELAQEPGHVQHMLMAAGIKFEEQQEEY